MWLRWQHGPPLASFRFTAHFPAVMLNPVGHWEPGQTEVAANTGAEGPGGNYDPARWLPTSWTQTVALESHLFIHASNGLWMGTFSCLGCWRGELSPRYNGGGEVSSFEDSHFILDSSLSAPPHEPLLLPQAPWIGLWNGFESPAS